MMLMRRKMSRPKLAYWLSGEDAPVDGKWVDRVTKDKWILYNGASYDATNKLYLFDTPTKCAALSKAFDDGFSSALYLGHHWMFEFDLYANRYQSKNSMIFFDIGSVKYAEKALGFGVGTKGESGASAFLNWKLNGNESNPFPATISQFHPVYPLMPENEYVHVVGCYRMIDGKDGYDRLQATVNGITVLFDYKVPKVEYNSWSSNAKRVVVGRSAFNVPSATDNSYSLCCKIHDIKIYIID